MEDRKSRDDQTRLPAVLRGIQGEEVHAGKDARQSVEVGRQAGGELAPGGEEQHEGTLSVVGV